MVSVVIFLAISEYVKLTPAGARGMGTGAIATATGVVMPYLFHLYGAGSAMPFVVLCSFLFFLNGMFRGGGAARLVSDEDDGRGSTLRAAHLSTLSGTLGVVYIAAPMSYLISLRDLPSGGKWIILLFAVIWLNDTCAFAAGRAFGRTRLCPGISPKKTVEGAVAGLAGGMTAGYVLNSYFSLGSDAAEVLGLSLLIGVVGIIGDLAESLLKRSANVKDSGSIIPGHGGVLDRIDSLIFTIPLLYYYLIWRI